MALSVQNKNFLAVLNKLDIDIKQFPDKTFDGLFENVPESTSFFFNWFIENITSDNALTQSEQATYFQLENSQSLPNEEEINFVLASYNPGYDELMSLDINYVKNFQSQDLEDLKKYWRELSDIFSTLEFSYSDIKKKQNSLKEDINFKKKQLITVKEECNETDLLFASRVDEVKMFLLKEPLFNLKINLFNELLTKEKNIMKELKSCKLLENKLFNFSKMDSLHKLEEDLACIEISLVLSEGFLTAKKAKVEFLSELLHNENSLRTFSDYNLVNDEEGMEIKISEEIKVLESQLFVKWKEVANYEVKKIYDYYLEKKIDLNEHYLLKLSSCKDYVKSNWKLNSCLLHILLRCISYLDKTLDLRKQLLSTLNEYETNFANDITNLELRKQRYKEVSMHDNQYPLLLEFKSIMNIKENPEDNEESLKNIIEIIQQANDDCNFITHKFRSDLQSLIKGLFDNTLCGPTSQLLFVPVELLIKFQDCDEQESNLSQVLKRLASKYVDAKETISKSDRRSLLLWIDFLTNPEALRRKYDSSQS